MGTKPRSGPRTATSTAKVTKAAAVPRNAGRQPWMMPTASTMVKASTISTSEARKEAVSVDMVVRLFMEIRYSVCVVRGSGDLGLKYDAAFGRQRELQFRAYIRSFGPIETNPMRSDIYEKAPAS